jgi:arylsulfatase A-like enzyme
MVKNAHFSRFFQFQVKGTPWEGGSRTVALMWSKALQKKKRVSNQLMHISDWLPTLYSAAGKTIS